MMSSLLLERSAVGILQLVTGDSRPDPNVKQNTTGGTFPSGHTTSVSAFAGVIQARHGFRASSLFHAAALYTGLTRIADGAHRPHEVVAGLGLGYAIGFASGQALNEVEKENPEFALVPTYDSENKAYGIMLQVRF